MVLTKYFSLFGLSVYLSKNIFTFKCGFLNGSKTLIYIWKLHFSKHLEYAKILKYSVPQSQSLQGPLRDTKTSKFFSHSFSQCNLEKLIRSLICFCCMVWWGLSLYIETKLHSTCFHLMLSLLQRSGTTLPVSFSAYLKKNICLVISYWLTKFHFLVSFTWDIGQYVHGNCL